MADSPLRDAPCLEIHKTVVQSCVDVVASADEPLTKKEGPPLPQAEAAPRRGSLCNSIITKMTLGGIQQAPEHKEGEY